MFTDDHNILTENNIWKSLLDLQEGDKVATLNTDADKIIFTPVTSVKRCEYNDQIYHICVPDTDFRVTMNHTLFAKIYDEKAKTWSEYTYYTANDIIGKQIKFKHAPCFGIINEGDDPGVERIYNYNGTIIQVEIDSPSKLFLIKRNGKAAWISFTSDEDVEHTTHTE